MKSPGSIRKQIGSIAAILAILAFAASPFLLISHDHEHASACSTCVSASLNFDLHSLDLTGLSGLSEVGAVAMIDDPIFSRTLHKDHNDRAPPAV